MHGVDGAQDVAGQFEQGRAQIGSQLRGRSGTYDNAGDVGFRRDKRQRHGGRRQAGGACDIDITRARGMGGGGAELAVVTGMLMKTTVAPAASAASRRWRMAANWAGSRGIY